MNKVFLIGRVTKDVELKQTQNGVPVTSFSVAVQRRGDREQADFITCVAWRKTAELASQFVGKGDQIAVLGHLETRDYEKNGVKVYATDVIAEEIKFLQRKKEAKTESALDGFVEADDDGYLPF